MSESAASVAGGALGFSVESIIMVIRSATKEQLADIFEALQPGLEAYEARINVVEKPVVKAPKAAEPKEKKPRSKKAAAAAAEAESDAESDGGVPPTADHYRMDAADIDRSKCLGRIFKESRKDTNWAPVLYYELQCGAKPASGSTICSSCASHQKAYKEIVENGEKPKHKGWFGILTEEPVPHAHMLGTAWAIDSRSLKWKGKKVSVSGPAGTAAAAAAGGGSTDDEESVAAAPVKTVVKKTAAPAAAAPVDIEETVPAKTVAKKETAPVKPAAAAGGGGGAAAPVKKTTKKEAEEKPAAAPTKKAPAAKGKKAAAAAAAAEVEEEVVPVRATTTAAAVKPSFHLELINGEQYAFRGRNAYEWDSMNEEPGAFCGRLNADNDDIDVDEDEVADDEETWWEETA